MNISSTLRRLAVGVVAAAAMFSGTPVTHAATPTAAVCDAEGWASADFIDTSMVCNGTPDVSGVWHLAMSNGVVNGTDNFGMPIHGTYIQRCTVYVNVVVHICVSVRIWVCNPTICAWVNIYFCIDIRITGCILANVEPYSSRGVLTTEAVDARRR